MITRAYLVAGRDAGPFDQVIGGLPTLLRQALSLQAAGIQELVLVGMAASSLSADARLRLDIREGREVPAHADRPALVAPAGAIWDPAVLERFVTSQTPGPRPIPMPASSFIVPRTPVDANAATAVLIRSLYKPTDGIISRYMNRSISLMITRRLLPFHITPNAVTAIASVFGVAAIFVASRGGYQALLAGTILFEIQSILDGCDGEIARLKYQQSIAGEWFDQVADDLLNIGFLMAVGLGLTAGGHAYVWPLALVALAFQIVYVIALYVGLTRKTGGHGSVAALRWWVEGRGLSEPRSQGRRATMPQVATRVIGDLTRRDFICFAYFATAVIGWIQIAFLWHVAVTVLSGVVTAVGWLVFGGPELRAAPVNVERG